MGLTPLRCGHRSGGFEHGLQQTRQQCRTQRVSQAAKARYKRMPSLGKIFICSQGQHLRRAKTRAKQAPIRGQQQGRFARHYLSQVLQARCCPRWRGLSVTPITAWEGGFQD